MVTRQKRLHFGLFSYKLADATTNRSKILTLCFFPSRFSYSPEIQTIALKQRQEWRRDGLIFSLVVSLQTNVNVSVTGLKYDLKETWTLHQLHTWVKAKYNKAKIGENKREPAQCFVLLLLKSVVSRNRYFQRRTRNTS